MIEFKINKQEYKIDKITIQDYYNIYTKLALTGPQTQLEIVSLLSQCPINELKGLDQLQFTQLWNEVVNVPLNLHDGLEFKKYIELGGKLYGFTDLKKITIGEIADMDVISKDPRKDQFLHRMMAILYRPAVNITDDWIVVDDYKAEEVEARAELFLQMPVEYVYGALNFFLHIRKYSIETMLDSLKTTEPMTKQETEMVQLTKQITLELLETGTTLSATSQAEMFLKLQRLQDLASTMPLTGLHTQKTEHVKTSSYMNRLWLKLTQKDKQI